VSRFSCCSVSVISAPRVCGRGHLVYTNHTSRNNLVTQSNGQFLSTCASYNIVHSFTLCIIVSKIQYRGIKLSRSRQIIYKKKFTKHSRHKKLLTICSPFTQERTTLTMQSFKAVPRHYHNFPSKRRYTEKRINGEKYLSSVYHHCRC
jgi:hypothetical protein